MANLLRNKKQKQLEFSRQDFECSAFSLGTDRQCSLSETASTTDSNLFDPKRFPQKRQRKSKGQIAQLQEISLNKRTWTKSDIKALALQTDLNPNQVYKWLWENKRLRDTFEPLHAHDTLETSTASKDMLVLQKSYWLAMKHYQLKYLHK